MTFEIPSWIPFFGRRRIETVLPEDDSDNLLIHALTDRNGKAINLYTASPEALRELQQGLADAAKSTRRIKV